ncbi:hypothetical protein [Candidatus Nitrospira bockiana]
MQDEEKAVRIQEFGRGARALLELLERGEALTGVQENTVIDTIHALQLAYNDWFRRQPHKEQSFPADQQ